MSLQFKLHTVEESTRVPQNIPLNRDLSQVSFVYNKITFHK